MTLANFDLKLQSGYLLCSGIPDHEEHEPARWCDHIELVIQNGWDAILIGPGHNLNVPIFPTRHIFAPVTIYEVTYPNGGAPMSMHYTPDIGRSYDLSLGIWNPGEGMGVIRRVIIDHMRGELDPAETLNETQIISKCPSNRTHSVLYTRQMSGNIDLEWKLECLWNIVFEKMCTLCLKAASDPLDDGTRGVSAGGNAGSFSGRFA